MRCLAQSSLTLLSALDTKQVGLAQGNQQKPVGAEGRASAQTRWEQAEATTKRSPEQCVHTGEAWSGRGFSQPSAVRGFGSQVERASIHHPRSGDCQEKAGPFPPEASYYVVFLLNPPSFSTLASRTLNLSLLAGRPQGPPSPESAASLDCSHWIPVGWFTFYYNSG